MPDPFTPPRWEDVADRYRAQFPDMDVEEMRTHYNQVRETSLAHVREQERNQPTLGEFVGERVPFGSSVQAITQNPERRRQIQESERSEPDAGRFLFNELTKVPAMIGEAALGGYAARGLGAVAPRALGFLAPTAPAATRLGAAGGALGRTAFSTATMPSMYIPRAVENADAHGGEWYDPRNLAPAYALGAMNVAVLGRINSRVGMPTGTFLERVAASTGRGMLEQQGVDLMASSIDLVAQHTLGQSLKLDTGFGLAGQFFNEQLAGTRPEEGQFARHFLTQAVTFAAFASMHDLQHRRAAGVPPESRAAAEALRNIADRVPDPDVAAKKFIPIQDAIFEAIKENPSATRQQVLDAGLAAIDPRSPTATEQGEFARQFVQRYPEHGVATEHQAAQDPRPGEEAMPSEQRQSAPVSANMPPNQPSEQSVSQPPGVPIMITRQMVADLKARGFTDAEINRMKPVEAWEKINQPPPEPTSSPSPEPNVWQRMPLQQLQRQAKTGVLGAQQELARRQAEPPSDPRAGISTETPPEPSGQQGLAQSAPDATTGQPEPIPAPSVESQKPSRLRELMARSEEIGIEQGRAETDAEKRDILEQRLKLSTDIKAEIDKILSPTEATVLWERIQQGTTHEAIAENQVVLKKNGKPYSGRAGIEAIERRALGKIAESAGEDVAGSIAAMVHKAEKAAGASRLAESSQTTTADQLGNTEGKAGKKVVTLDDRINHLNNHYEGLAETNGGDLSPAQQAQYTEDAQRMFRGEAIRISEEMLQAIQKQTNVLGENTKAIRKVFPFISVQQAREIVTQLKEGRNAIEHAAATDARSQAPEVVSAPGTVAPVANANNDAQARAQVASPGERPPDSGPVGATSATGGGAEQSNPAVGAAPSVEQRSVLPGGGQINQADPSPPRLTALANAQVDKERAKNGLPEIMAPARRANPEVWDRAMEILERDPQASIRLIDELSQKSRATTVDENALLLHRKIVLANEHEKVMLEFVRGFRDKASEATMAELEARETALLGLIDQLDHVTRATGTEWGRAGQFRRQLAAEDFSLAHMLMREQVARRRELTKEEKVEITKLHEKIKELQSQVDAQEDTQRENSPTRQKANRDAGNLAQRLAKQFIEGGMTEREAVIDAVHNELNNLGHEMTRRETMDAISGYGKYTLLNKEEAAATLRDLKGQMQQLGKLEDMQTGKAPLKTGGERRTPSAEERDLIKQVNEAKKKGGYDVLDPEKQLKTALDAVKTRLRNQIEDLGRSIESHQELVKDRSELKYDAEAERLRAERDKLKEQYDEIFGTREMTDEQRIRLATAAVEKSVAEYERRIKEKDFSSLSQPSKTPKTAELETLRARRDSLREELAEMRNAADQNMQRPPEMIRNQAYKTATTNRIAELQDRIARGDFERPQKTEPAPFNKGNLKLQSELEQLKDRFQEGVLRLEAQNRPAWEKTLSILSKVRRAEVLSSPVTIAKLTSAAFERLVITPMEQVVARGIGLAFPKVFEKATYEGRSSIAIEARAISDAFTHLAEDAKSVWKTGEMDIGQLYGKKRYNVDPAWTGYLEAFGRMHAVLKTAPKRAAFSRALQQGAEAAMRNGFDVTDITVQTRLRVEAYKQAERSIFQQDNWMVNMWNRAIRPAPAPVRFIGETALPIVRVPTNIVIETFQHAFGSLSGSVQLARAYAKGIDSLPPEQADSIMRQLKKGSMGLAMMAAGFYFSNKLGGYYQHGEHRDENDVPVGGVRVAGYDVPSYLVHNPLLGALQIGATFRRVWESQTRDGERGPIVGASRAILGLVEEVPFVRETTQLGELTGPHPEHAFGREVQSLAIPQALSWTASQLDRDATGKQIRRSPNGVWEYVQSGIPVLRERLPQRLR